MTIGDSLGPDGKPPGPQGVGGWLGFLCLSLVVFAPLGVVRDVAGLLNRHDFAIEDIFGAAAEVAMAGFAIFVGVSLIKIRHYAVRLAKIFYFISLAFGFMAMLAVFAPDATPTDLAIGVWTIIVSTAWLLYLYRSERVRVTYGRAAAANISEVFR